MSKYLVAVSIGTVSTEVDADDEESAVDAAIEEMRRSAEDYLLDGTISVREVESDAA